MPGSYGKQKENNFHRYKLKGTKNIYDGFYHTSSFLTAVNAGYLKVGI